MTVGVMRNTMVPPPQNGKLPVLGRQVARGQRDHDGVVAGQHDVDHHDLGQRGKGIPCSWLMPGIVDGGWIVLCRRRPSSKSKTT